jgi:Fur family iron response transcriptional regulator
MNRLATSPPLSAEAVAEELRSHDILPTHQRLEIARALFTCRQHLSADQVLAMVNAERPHVSKATVYNTLNLLARKGLVREVIVDPSRVFYDPNTAPHHHFYNVDTGELTDVAPEEFVLDTVPDAPPGTITEGVDVIIRVRSADRT